MPLLPLRLDDPGDPRLVPYLGLRDPARRRDLEAATGVFVAEGWKAVARLLGSGLVVRSVVVAAERGDRVAGELPEPPGAVPLLLVPRPVLDRVAGFAVHRGVLALAERPPGRDWRNLAGAARRLLIVEGVNDQANLGSLFRSAAGLGVDAVLLCPRACDPLYRRTVRVSLGASFLLPWARVAPWPAGLAELADEGWTVAALTPGGRVGLDEAGLATRERVAVLVGSEGDGLSAAAERAATAHVAIPMAAGTDSLNVAVAAAIALWAARAAGPR